MFFQIQTDIYIYKYIFRSNSRGLAPLGPARPDKFINLATLGPSALASRGTNERKLKSLSTKMNTEKKKKNSYLIAGKEVDVLTANATKSVMVVIVTVAPVRDITSLTVLTTPNWRGCRSSSSTRMNISSMPILITR